MELNRFSGILTASVMLCAGVVSCGIEDAAVDGTEKNDEPLVVMDKRLLRSDEPLWGYEGNVHMETLYYYGGQGLVDYLIRTKIGLPQGDVEDAPYTFVWSNNDRDVERMYQDSRMAYMIDYLHGKVLKAVDPSPEGDFYRFEYDETGRISRIFQKNKYQKDITYDFFWKGNLVTKILVQDNEENTNNHVSNKTELLFDYSGKEALGGHLVMSFFFGGLDLLRIHPELFGMVLSDIPSHVTGCRKGKLQEKTQVGGEFLTITYSEDMDFSFDAIAVGTDRYVQQYTMTEKILSNRLFNFRDDNRDGVITDDERNISIPHEFIDHATYKYNWVSEEMN